MGNKKKMQNISRHAEYCAALLGLNAFTSCGITRSFKCLGKVKHLKKLQSMLCFVLVLGRLEDSWQVPHDLMDVLENPRTTSLNELHYMKLTHLCATAASALEASKCIDFANLPPLSSI